MFFCCPQKFVKAVKYRRFRDVAFWVHSAGDAQRMDCDSNVAGGPGISLRTKRRSEDTENCRCGASLVHRGFECRGCGRRLHQVHDVREREIRDLPWSVYRATVIVEVHRLRCPECGVRVEKIEQLPSKAPFSKRFEEIVGQACESAAASQVARRFQLPETTVRAIDMRYLERWDQRRRKPALKQMGVDEIYRGKKDKFLTVVSNLETGEPLWFGKERKKETLDEYFRTELSRGQRKRIVAACVVMWEPF